MGMMGERAEPDLAMRRTARRCCLGLLVLLLAACAGEPRVRAHVESFTTLSQAPAGDTVAVAPFDARRASSLEYQTYAGRVVAALERRGLEVVGADADPRWRLAVGYGIDDGREIVDSYSVPDFGYGWADRRVGRYGGYRYPTYRTEVVSRIVHTRHLVLALADTNTGNEAWRARVVSVGQCPGLEPVFDAMLAAALDGFPEAGSRSVDVTLDGGC